MHIRFRLPRWAGVAAHLTTVVTIIGNMLPIARHGVTLFTEIGIAIPKSVSVGIAVAGVTITLLSEALGRPHTEIIQTPPGDVTIAPGDTTKPPDGADT